MGKVIDAAELIEKARTEMKPVYGVEGNYLFSYYCDFEKFVKLVNSMQGYEPSTATITWSREERGKVKKRLVYFCSRCKKENDRPSDFCPNCGGRRG